MFHISKIKKGIIHLRIWMKIIVLVSISILLVVGAILMFYKPTYEVIYNEKNETIFLSGISPDKSLTNEIKENYKRKLMSILLMEMEMQMLHLCKFRACQNMKCVY